MPEGKSPCYDNDETDEKDDVQPDHVHRVIDVLDGALAGKIMFANGAGDGEFNEEERRQNDDGIQYEYSLEYPAFHAVST